MPRHPTFEEFCASVPIHEGITSIKLLFLICDQIQLAIHKVAHDPFIYLSTSDWHELKAIQYSTLNLSRALWVYLYIYLAYPLPNTDSPWAPIIWESGPHYTLLPHSRESILIDIYSM